MAKSKCTYNLMTHICILRSEGNTMKGIAEILGLHRNTILSWLKKGEKARIGKYAKFYNDWQKATENYYKINPPKNTYASKNVQKRLLYSQRGMSKFKREVLERDNYTCVCCGYDDELEIHHLEGVTENPDLMAVVDNGVTLCRYCHLKFHHIYTRRGFNSNDFSEFMNNFQVVKEF